MSAPQKRRRAATVLAVLFACGAAGALCHVWIRMRAVHLAYAIANERKTLDELLQAQRQLRAELAYLKAPARIEQIGRDRLGMAPPTAIREVRLPHPRKRKESAPR